MKEVLLQTTLLQVCCMPTAAGMVSSGISNVLLTADLQPQSINKNKPLVALHRSRAGWRTHVEPLSLARSWSVTSWG